MTQSASNAREAILSAFNRVVLSMRHARPPIARLLREAGVARSTFYKHFSDRDSLLLEAMCGPLSVIAHAVTAADEDPRFAALLAHFWEQRRGATEVFSGAFAARLVRALAAKIAERAPELEKNDALRLAETQMAFLRLWLSGETPGTAAMLSQKLVASARAQRAAFSPLAFQEKTEPR